MHQQPSPLRFGRAFPWVRGGRALADSLFASSPERLILICRLITSGFGLLAIWLDPTQPARNGAETYTVLAGYVLFSALLALRPSRRPLNNGRHVLTHAADILILCVLAFLTGELASPFYAYFTFALITGAMRWGVRGALVTAVILDVLLIPIGWPYGDPGTSDLNVLIMRSAYAIVAAVMLGYFASYRERSRGRLAQLAAWPVDTAGDGDEPALAGSLQHASDVLGTGGLLVLWLDDEEPSGRLAWWDGRSCTMMPVPAIPCERIIDREGARAAFHDEDLLPELSLPAAMGDQLPESLKDAAARRRSRRTPAFCSAAFSSPHYRGRVFVVDPGPAHEDMLSLTEIVAARIASALEQFVLMRELEVMAGVRERSRLARDLHDSVLQDLTAAVLQLKTANQDSPEAMHSAAGLVSGILADQQRRIRRFVEEARSIPLAEASQPLGDQLQTLADVLGEQWHCAVEIDVRPKHASIPPDCFAGLCQIISEATANAVRHGGAERIIVKAGVTEEWVEVEIGDDGRGLPDAVAARGVRPRSISERIADLGGELTMGMAGQGLNLYIRLPL